MMTNSVVGFFRRSWVAWFAILLALGAFLYGRHGVGPQEENAFTTNVFVEIIGVFIALAVAWVVFERVAQAQGERSEAIAKRLEALAERADTQTEQIRTGVHLRLRNLRSAACWPVTSIADQLTNPITPTPAMQGPYYVENNYETLRTTLGVPDSGGPIPFVSRFPRFAGASGIRAGPWGWIFNEFAAFSSACETTIRLFGTGLAEYPTVLTSFETLIRSIEVEQKLWNLARDRRTDELPIEAVINLTTIAKLTLSVIASVTYVLNDWEPLPPEQDTKIASTFFYNAGWERLS